MENEIYISILFHYFFSGGNNWYYIWYGVELYLEDQCNLNLVIYLNGQRFWLNDEI